MLPDVATMFVAGTGAGVMDLDFWADVYGFSYRYCDCAPLSLFSQDCRPQVGTAAQDL